MVWVRDHHIQHMRSAVHYTYAKVPGFSTDIYNFLISWQGREHLAQRVGRSQLLPVLARLLRGSAVSACVKILGKVYKVSTIFESAGNGTTPE
jgi:hypothetical protein